MPHGYRKGPYTFDVVAWEAWPPTRGGDGQRRSGLPARPQSAHGLKVIVTNPNDLRDTHQYWVYTLQQFKTWAGWWLYISGDMGEHGMALAPDGAPPDPTSRDRTGRFSGGGEDMFASPEGWEEEGE